MNSADKSTSRTHTAPLHACDKTYRRALASIFGYETGMQGVNDKSIDLSDTVRGEGSSKTVCSNLRRL